MHAACLLPGAAAPLGAWQVSLSLLAMLLHVSCELSSRALGLLLLTSSDPGLLHGCLPAVLQHHLPAMSLGKLDV